MNYRVGIGYDIHRLVLRRKLILGGAKIPYGKGPLAHSDGDVLLHALCDAILGAAGLGDIGMHFPDTEKQYKNISSLKLLEMSSKKIAKAGYGVVNVDCVLILDEPKIGPYRKKMLFNLMKTLKIPGDSVNIKATTSEGTGEIGSSSIASYCVALLKKKR